MRNLRLNTEKPKGRVYYKYESPTFTVIKAEFYLDSFSVLGYNLEGGGNYGHISGPSTEKISEERILSAI